MIKYNIIITTSLILLINGEYIDNKYVKKNKYAENNAINKYFSSNDKVRFIFNVFDSFPKNDYLEYNEVELLQKITDPQLPLNIDDYKYVCKLLNSNIYYGITLDEFNSSYYLYRHELGTNLNKDFDIVYELVYNSNKI